MLLILLRPNRRQLVSLMLGFKSTELAEIGNGGSLEPSKSLANSPKPNTI